MSDAPAPLPFLSANIRQSIRDLAELAGFVVSDVPRPAAGPEEGEVPQWYRMTARGIHNGMTMEPGSLVLLHKHEVGTHHVLHEPEPAPAEEPAAVETPHGRRHR